MKLLIVFFATFLLMLDPSFSTRISSETGEVEEKGYSEQPQPESNPVSDLDLVRQRILAELLAPAVDESSISSLVGTIREDGSWPGINYEDVSRTGYEHRQHISNMLALSHAYRKPGSSYTGHATVKKVISSAADFWIAHDFIADNWHSNEIGNPTQWAHILLLMEGELTDKQAAGLARMADRANLDAWGARPGGDLIKIAGIMAEMAIYRDDEQALKSAVATIAGEIRFSTGNGMKHDYSFHHRTDRVTSILSYGTGYAEAFAEWAARLAGTSYRLPESALKLLIDYYLDGICQTMVHGWYKDPGAINRAMSRQSALSPAGPELPLKLLQASNYRRQELENIIKIRRGELPPVLSGNRFFWHSEYLSHQRPGYFTSVRMFSERNHNMEAPHNEESLKHHHYADGSNFLSRTGKEYYDIYPVWDWQKIPGATIVQKPALPHWREIVKAGKTDFVGAVSDGRYGAAAFDLESPHDPLRARKSWFFFDDEYVCLGAGINSTAEYPVATTLNQCLLNGEVIVQSGRKKLTLPPKDHQLKDVSWVSHDGVVYLFRTPTPVFLSNRTFAGKWSDITNSSQASQEEVRKELFALWLDHGQQPGEASYEYLVLPGMEARQLEAYQKAASVRTLVNTPKIQAVQHQGLGLTQIAFYEAGQIELAEGLVLAVDQPGLVMVKTSGRSIQKIVVADPTRKLTAFRLRVNARFAGAGDNWKASWNGREQRSDINIDLPDDAYAGSSVVMEGGMDGYTSATRTARSRNAARPGPTRPAGGHYVGEKFGGGVVVWVDDSGKHGLIAATSDQSSGIPWRNGPSQKSQHFGDHHDRVTNARADGIGAGQENTRLIVELLTEDDPAGDFAAKVCTACRTEGYDDWYLPSKAELKLIHQSRNAVGGFSGDLYWSSTEYNVGFVWSQGFEIYGGEYTQTKSSRLRIRCVRKF